MNRLIEMRRQLGTLLEAARALADGELTAETRAQADALLVQADELEQDIAREERLQAMLASKTAPARNTTGLGDGEERALVHWMRTGDAGGMEQRASNDTDMNIGTPADGGVAVPTGHYRGIIARRDESMLASKLGVRAIPGQGTTVNVPLDAEDDGEFVATNEAQDSDRDAPALSVKAMTLVRYTKRVELSYELLEDEDSRLLAFLADFVGRGMAKTHNGLLLTEVAANGKLLKSFGSATAIAVSELEPMVFDDDLSNYLDDSASVAWVMRPSVYGKILVIDDAKTRRYAPNAQGDAAKPSVLGYPVQYSAKAGSTAASAKSAFFGNWNYVGFREAPGFTVLRDPYSLAKKGQVVFHYYFRTVYGVLQAEAIGFGQHPTA